MVGFPGEVGLWFEVGGRGTTIRHTICEAINYLNLSILVEGMVMLIYCPCQYEDEAHEIARWLLDKKLIACANVFDSASFYTWKGKRKETTEWVLVAKTTKAKAKKAAAEIKKIHSYECPAIITFSAKANKEFEQWVSASVNKSTSP